MPGTYFYPRSPCGERLLISTKKGQVLSLFLSTLSLRRATCQRTRSAARATSTFLSTLSLRRATNRDLASHCGNNNFYPRSPCGERPEVSDKVPLAEYFYPRSPCGERQALHTFPLNYLAFLSTLSLRRATPTARRDDKYNVISIHALLAESDSKSAQNSGALLRI